MRWIRSSIWRAGGPVMVCVLWGKGVSVLAPFKIWVWHTNLTSLLTHVLDLNYLLLPRLRTRSNSFSEVLINSIVARMTYLKCKVWLHLSDAYQLPITLRTMSEHLNRTCKILSDWPLPISPAFIHCTLCWMLLVTAPHCAASHLCHLIMLMASLS